MRTASEAGISGEISANSDWNEDIYFFDSDGDALSLTGLTFYMQFRCDPAQTSADVTLSTTAGTLSLEVDGGSVTSILRIDVGDDVFTSYADSDMVVDIVAVDSSSVKTHYGHGTISVLNDPATI
jgi:hypothetical protein